MENIFLCALIISITYFILKFINLKFIKKSDEALKPIFMDSLFVFVSVILGLLINDQFNVVSSILGDKTNNGGINAFVSAPEF